MKLPVLTGVKTLNPIQLASGPEGKLFAANQSGEVYILEDSDGDGMEDNALQFCNVTDFNLRSPAGFAHKGDTVFIGTSQEIRAFIDRNKDGKADTSWTFYNDIPHSQHPYEWTSGLSFGPDGWLYCALTTDSWNAAPSPDPAKFRGAIIRISPDGKRAESVATGIRSVHGMAFNRNGDLFFTDNEGGGNAREELNRVVRGGFYGHNPNKYKGHDSVINPAHALETEAAPAGIAFNTPENNFGGAAGNLFIAFYGPGERWKRGGIGRVQIQPGKDGNYTYQEFPVADIPKLSALAFGKSGALYLAHHGVSDYWYNSVEEKSGGFYKVVYDPSLVKKPVKRRAVNAGAASAGSIESGKQLFDDQACSACHAAIGAELLGPNLSGVGKRLSRQDILEEIQFPSKIIKPSMGATRVIKKDGQVLLGRVINTDTLQVSLMLIGNKVVRIPRSEIQKTEPEKKSLMYENLLNGLSKEEINNLLDYVISLQ
jgi:putative heme-binding domain-containing protein